MNPMPGRCPVCSNALAATRLQCGQCGTGIDGLFALGRLQALTPEQIQFVETFIKCRGKIKDVEAELGISYPTVVGRLNEVVRSMGYEVEEGDMSEVDQYEYYEARMINPQAPRYPAPTTPTRPTPPTAPTPPTPPTAPASPYLAPRPRIRPEKRQQILDDLAAGKISAAEAMEKLNG